MFNRIVSSILNEYINTVHHVSGPVPGPSSIINGSLPTGFKGAGVAGIAPSNVIPLKIKKKKKIKKAKA